MLRLPVIFSILFLVVHIDVSGQNFLLKKLEKSVTKKLGDKGTDLRVQLDSVDFQYAISLNQGAGFFDIEQKGETTSKLLYGFKESDDKTMVDKARDSLETGIGMYNIRRYELAELTIRGTKLLMENHRLTDEIVYLRVLSNLGLITLTQGKTFEADEFIHQSLDKSESSLGKNSPAYIANLNNLAKLHQFQGKYNEAEKEFNEAIEYAEEVFGGGMQMAILLNNKAMLFQAVGRYDEAIRIMNEAIDASERAPKKVFEGKKSFDNRKFLANLATLYQVSGQYDKAETKFQEIRKIFENRRQTKNSEYAGLMNQMGILYIQMEKMDQVEEYLTTSATVYKKRFGENNIYFAKVINDLGNFHRMIGNYTNAEKWLDKSFSIRKELLDPAHPDYINTQEDLAILYWKTDRPEQAYDFYKKVMDKTIDFVNRYFPPMSESEKTKFWDVTSPRFQRFYNFAFENHAQVNGIKKDVFNYNMATKGLLLNATNKVKDAILSSNDQQLIKDYIAWIDLKEQLARMYGYSKSKLQKQNIDLGAMEREANAMEKSLSERSANFSSAFTRENKQFEDVTGLLADNEVVVDLIRVTQFDQDFTNEVLYAALIIKKGSADPELVILNNGSLLESRYFKYYQNAIRNKIEDEYTYDQYWARVHEAIKGKQVLYFSPDGVYNQISINTIREPNESYVLNNYDLVLLGNASDLISLKKGSSSKPSKEAFLLGFPDYETPSVSSLPGTEAEIIAVANILKTDGFKTNTFMAQKATESNVKNLKSPQIVHIATHGYFMEDTRNSKGSVFGVNPENASNNPLLRAGLMLAGIGKTLADTAAADVTSNDNGILTAYEAMNLSLEETNLVVLSACQTGLGDVKSGEGVYGLQRAFLVAGADALIMSLWKVDDKATQLLMTNFYKNWIKSGDKHEAFRQSQLQLMKIYKEPYYWGAFVMVGG